jgi:sodium-coupled neutral amino acid transporter 7/8
MRGSIFALMQTAVGAGILSLPYVVKSCGILPSVFFLIVGGVSAYWTMVWLIKAAFATQKDNYAHIVEDILGHGAAIFLNVVFILLTYGVGTLYFIVASTFMPSILKGFGMDDTTADDDNTRMIFIAATCMLLFPVGL